MNQDKIYEVLHSEKFKIWLKIAFAEAGITTVELLKDDKRVEDAALLFYEKIPLFPFRAAVKATIGKEGFTKLVFGIRDKLLTSNSLDLTKVSQEYCRSILSQVLMRKGT